MKKAQSIIKTLKKKSLAVNLGNQTYKIRLLNLALFALAFSILLIAIIVLIIVNASASSEPVAGEVAQVDAPSSTSSETQAEFEIEVEPEDPIGEPVEPLETEVPVETQITPEPTVEPTATPAPADGSVFTGTLKKGDSGEIVKVIQQRLVDLYYMDYPIQENGSYSVTSKYGQTSCDAIKLFQERNGLTSNGECDAETYEKLMSDNANAYIMKKNDKCTMVKVIQTKLKEKGYMDKVTGLCGDDTITAVTNFQKASGLTPDGIAGPGTLKILLGH